MVAIRHAGLRCRSLAACVLGALSGALACEPTLEVGALTCAAADGASVPGVADPIATPWSSGFENRFCDYSEVGGFCYGDPRAAYEVVTSPAHSGRHAAAFTVHTDDPGAQQARCVRQGELPGAAYYGAWYFVPAPAENADLWNLFHFRGGEGAGYHALWDVSLDNGSDGSLQLFVFDQLSRAVHRPAVPSAVPIGTWFHIEFFLERAADATGKVALHQDGELLLELTDIVTDDSSIGQWYVGNLANGLTPAHSTLYVDDVTIRATL